LVRFYRVRDLEAKEISEEKLLRVIKEYVKSRREDLFSNIVISVDFAKLVDLVKMMRPGKA